MGKLVGSRFGKIAKLGSSSNSFVPGVMNDNQLFVFSSLYETLLPDITSLTVFVLITMVWRYQVKLLKKRKERLMVVTSDVRDVTFVVSLARLGLVTFNGLANAFTICTNQSDLWKSSCQLSWNWYQWSRREMSVFFLKPCKHLPKTWQEKSKDKVSWHKAEKNETGNPTATQKFLLFRKRFTDIIRFPFTFQQDIVLENICKWWKIMDLKSGHCYSS